VHAQDAAGAQECVDGAVVARDRAGVGLRQLDACARAAELVSNHRLAGLEGTTRGAGDAFGLAQRLQKQQDRLRLRVVYEQLEQLGDR
jgi:hypothetical protein